MMNNKMKMKRAVKKQVKKIHPHHSQEKKNAKSLFHSKNLKICSLLIYKINQIKN